MKKILFAIAAISMFAAGSDAQAQLKIGKKNIDTKKVGQAVSDVATAVTLSDEDVAELCRKSIEWMDNNNNIADMETPWGQRLARLTGDITEVHGIKVNFKVYLVTSVNAFASGDGSVRIFSALMDTMNDEELMAIIGHELGHVANHDVKDAIKNAYLVSAGRNAVGAAGGVVGQLSDSELGEITESFMGAKFSRSQENEADEFGFNFAIEHGYSPYAMSNSLQRLVDLYGSDKSSSIDKMFSSHPDSDKRTVQTREMAEKYIKNNPESANITKGTTESEEEIEAKKWWEEGWIKVVE